MAAAVVLLIAVVIAALRLAAVVVTVIVATAVAAVVAVVCSARSVAAVLKLAAVALPQFALSQLATLLLAAVAKPQLLLAAVASTLLLLLLATSHLLRLRKRRRPKPFCLMNSSAASVPCYLAPNAIMKDRASQEVRSFLFGAACSAPAGSAAAEREATLHRQTLSISVRRIVSGTDAMPRARALRLALS